MVVEAQRSGLKNIVVPYENVGEAKSVKVIAII